MSANTTENISVKTNPSVFKVSVKEDMDDFFWTDEYDQMSKESVAGPDQFDRFRITAEMDIPEASPVIFLNGAPFAAKSNISVFSGPSKMGKTVALYATISGAISADGQIDGISGIQVTPNPDKNAVVAFDTEQAESDLQYLVKTCLNRNGLYKTPDHLYCFSIRGLAPKERQKFTSSVLSRIAGKHETIHSIYIDGGADYITSVNDEELASSNVQYATNLAIEYDCPVIVVVHTNPGGEKERGHYGSDLQRKCYGMATVTKDGDVSTLQAKLLRKAGIGDAGSIHFEYDTNKGYHVTAEDPKSNSKKAMQKSIELKALANTVFESDTLLSRSVIQNKIMKLRNIKETAAKTYMNELIGFELIEKTGDLKNDKYRLTPDRSE